MDYQKFIDGTELHPFNNTLRIWEKKVLLETYWYEDRVELGAIISLTPGQGDGQKCMEWLKQLAAPSPITGKIDPVPGTNFNRGRLRAWYKRMGATLEKNDWFVIKTEEP